MPSPDIRNYVDLTVYDLQPTDVYDAAVEYATTALPEWQPVPGSIEDALLQAAASMTGQLIGAINRLPSGVVEALLKLYGVERVTGTPPTGEVTFTATHFNGATVPVGTRLGYFDTTGDEPVLYAFETTESATIPVGSNTAVANIRGLTSNRYPQLMINESLQLLSALSFVDSIVLNDDLDPGENPESDTDYVGRATAAFGQLSDALVLPQQMDNFLLLTYPSIYRSKSYSRVRGFRLMDSLNRTDDVVAAVFAEATPLQAGDAVRVLGSDDEFNGTFLVDEVDGPTVYWAQTGANASAAPGVLLSLRFQEDFYDIETESYLPQNGYVTTYVSAIGGASVNDGVLVAAMEDVTERTVAGLISVVDHARVTPITVNVTITKDQTTASSAVQAAVTDAVAGYIHPDHWSWEESIFLNEVIALIDRVPGVRRVVSITLTADEDLAEVDGITGNVGFRFSGVLPLATTNVTVEI